MTDTTRYDAMMQALTELAPEFRKAPSRSQPLQPGLASVLQEYLPLPTKAVFLGIATDGFPVLLSLADPTPGPLLIAGDANSGKTSLLQVIARAVEVCSEASDVRYGVISGKPDEWDDFQSSAHRVDVFPASTSSAQEFVRWLDDRAHSDRKDGQSLLLLIDDLSKTLEMSPDALQSLRWLLFRGPARNVWPIVTINPNKVPDIQSWTSFFHTRLFGQIQKYQDVEKLTDGARPRLESLAAGSEFMMREGTGWLRFWIPSQD